MATHQVFGCYKASDGSVEFADTETGCDAATITGCYVTSGEHAGKIQITHDYTGCETQHYACYDPATGKFQFEVDDGCCIETGDDCGGCEPTTPRFLSLTITGVTDCPSDGDADTENCTLVNDTFILEQTGNTCIWRYTEGVADGDITAAIQYSIMLDIWNVTAGIHSTAPGLFNFCFTDQDALMDADCLAGSATNEHDDCATPASGLGGVATIIAV